MKDVGRPCPLPGCSWMCVDPDAYSADQHLASHMIEAHAFPEPPVIIWDDPPPDPDRPIHNQVILDWYRAQRGDEYSNETAGEYIARNQARMDEVQAEIDATVVLCATWLYPAVAAGLAALVVWASYRAVRR